MPVGLNHFDLTAQEFRDVLTLHYRKPLLNLPSCYDGCGAPSSPDHALCCRKGGLIIQCHYKICDAIGDLAALVWGRVLSEPVVKNSLEDSDVLITDLGVRGVWQSLSMALFVIRIVDTEALSYLSRSPAAVLASVEAEKKRKYCATSSDCCATFMPSCFSFNGLAGNRPIFFYDIWHILYLLPVSGIVVLVRSLAGCVLV